MLVLIFRLLNEVKLKANKATLFFELSSVD